MEWFWKVLNCQPTTKVSEIKKAYVAEIRRLKVLETKETVSEATYKKLDEAEKVAVAFLEKQGKQSVPKNYSSSLDEKTIKSRQRVQESLIKSDKQGLLSKQQASEGKEVERTTFKKVSSAEADEKERKSRLVDQDTEKSEKTVLQKMPKNVRKQDIPPTQETVRKNGENSVVLRTLNDIKDLLNDWPRKITLKEWEKNFRYRRQWTSQELNEIREQVIPLLKPQISRLPKECLLYIEQELSLGAVYQGAEANWLSGLANVPDFRFDVALWIPEEECDEYFDKRLALYHALSQEDWQNRGFEIDQLFHYFYAKDDWQEEYDIFDQDVENLAAIYQIQKNRENLVKGPNKIPEIEQHLLPVNEQLSSVDNQTAVFLRVIFNSFLRKSISLEDSLLIENPESNYLEPNLRDLLVGLAFYRCNQKEKAEKAFNTLNNEYHALIKSLEHPNGFKELKVSPPVVTDMNKKPINSKLLIRGIIAALMGLSLIGNLLNSDDQDTYQEEDETVYIESVEEDEEYYNPDDPGEGFLTYFVYDTDYRSDITTRRQDFIENYVSPDLVELFEEHLDDTDPTDFVMIDTLFYLADDGKMSYLILEDDQPKMMVNIQDNRIVEVIGNQWQAVTAKEFQELTTIFNIPVTEIIESIVLSYFTLPSDEREDELYYLYDLISMDVAERLNWDTSIIEEVDLAGGYYQLSQTVNKEDALLITDLAKELHLILVLDDFGRVSQVIEMSYDDYTDKEITYLKEHSQPAVPLDSVEITNL